MTGTIKNLRETFGFLQCADGIDRFFLPTALDQQGTKFNELQVGALVEFEHEDHPKGARAKNIRVIAHGG